MDGGLHTSKAVTKLERLPTSREFQFFPMRADRFCVPMIPVPSVRVIIAVSILATTLAIACRAAEKLPTHPQLVYRQIGAGYTLALETGRRDKTFFLCQPGKTGCISTKAIGWRKPFIIIRDGAVISPGFFVYDTEAKKYLHAVDQSALPSYLKNTPLDSAAVAWQKLSPTRPLW
jgi:hypothetical protein